ncbi:MAG: Ada metal-binding domain-containing protein [Vulcanimicrobiota bacterium]
MKKDLYKKEEITRKEFLQMGFSTLLGITAVGLIGCRDDNMPRPNIPVPKVYNFIGDPAKKVFHKHGCKFAPSENKAVFFDAPGAALSSGFRACTHCKPDRL